MNYIVRVWKLHLEDVSEPGEIGRYNRDMHALGTADCVHINPPNAF